MKLIRRKKRISKASGFTLIELIIVIGIIGFLAVAVLVAVNPIRRITESKDAQRYQEVMSLLEAFKLYQLDNLANPPGADGTLRMLGTASSGCDVLCGSSNVSGSIADDTQTEFDSGLYSNTIWQSDHIELSPGSSPYSTTGTFTSSITDAGSDQTWQNLSWNETQISATNWMNAAWSRRKTITINNSGNTSVLTNHQVRVKVSYDSDMNADFSDLRFTTSDGTTEIDYWIHEYTAGSEATVWLEVPTIPASSSTNVYMYYGNGSATTTSNGDNTFLLFDDFEDGTINTTKWNEIDIASNEITETGGNLAFTRTTNGSWNKALMANTTFPRSNLSFEADYRWIENNPSYDALMFGWHDNTGSANYPHLIYGFYNTGIGGGTTVSTSVYEDGHYRGGSSGSWTLGTDYDIRVRMRATGGAYYEQSTDGGDSWTTNYTSNYSTESNVKPAWAFYSGTHRFNNAFVRKWTSPEPSVSFSSEQTNVLTDIRIQVRSCDDAACSGESFVGPDGTTGTYYTTPGGQSLNVTDNQYFQYQVTLSTTDSSFTPELASVSVSTTGSGGELTASACLDLSSSLSDNYIDEIPYDPSVGSPEITYYALKVLSDNTVQLMSCYSENGEVIRVGR